MASQTVVDVPTFALLGPWAAKGACRTCDPGINFFPERGEDSRPAKEVCAGCEVREPCLEDALGEPKLKGIWGGTSDRQRKQIRAERDQLTLAQRLDAFEARLPVDLLDEWRLLRQELTGTPETVAAPTPILQPARTDGREVTCTDCHKPRRVSQQLESDIRRGKRSGVCRDCWRARKNPTPTTRICSRCHAEKPVDEFGRASRAGLDGRCNQCKAEISRERYLHVGQVAVTVELLEGDGLVGRLCPTCSLPFFAGERVVAGHICHMGCEA